MSGVGHQLGNAGGASRSYARLRSDIAINATPYTLDLASLYVCLSKGRSAVVHSFCD